MTAELARSVDLVIACIDSGFPGFRQQRLFADTEAVTVRRGHPLGARLQRVIEKAPTLKLGLKSAEVSE